jgi:hypothetical protein
MKTTILGILIMLSYNYCFAQLKVENSTPEPKKEDVYDVSQDLYIQESHRRTKFDPLDYKSYHKFINQRIFCISNEAFVPDGNRYALKRHFVNLPTPIKGYIQYKKNQLPQYKKKQLPFLINQVATYLYRPTMATIEPQSSDVHTLDDMRNDDYTVWTCYDMNSKKKDRYAMVLYGVGKVSDYNLTNKSLSYAGHFYLIKKILTDDEALKLLEEAPQIKLIAKSENTHTFGEKETYYYESLISGKTFLTQSVQNDILIKNNIDFGGSRDCESPIFLLESESGELFLTRLNEDKLGYDSVNRIHYNTYLLEKHIEYLKEKFIGKLYHIRCYPDPDIKGKIEDIVIRDNRLRVKYVNVETKDTGYRSMEWNSTGKLWVVADADEIIPKQSK